MFLAAPIPALPSLFTEFAGHHGIVTDLASTKGTVMRWAAAAGLDQARDHLPQRRLPGARRPADEHVRLLDEERTLRLVQGCLSLGSAARLIRLR